MSDRDLLRRLVGEIAYGVVNVAGGNLDSHGSFWANDAADELVSHLDHVLDGIAEGTEIGDVIQQLIDDINTWVK